MAYTASPMYSFIGDHLYGIVLPLLVAASVWVISRLRPGNAYIRRYRSMDPRRRLLVWVLMLDGSLHLGLAPEHGPLWGAGFLLFGLWEIALVGRVLGGRESWRRIGWAAGLGLIAYTVVSAGGTSPDQLGLLSKLLELTMLALALAPRHDRRLSRTRYTFGVSVMAVIVRLEVGQALSGPAGTATPPARPRPQGCCFRLWRSGQQPPRRLQPRRLSTSAS